MATPAIVDGPFRRSVVLLLDHDKHGALGIILNHPLDSDIDELLPEWGPFTDAPGRLFHGGPVEMDSAIAVGVLRGNDEPVGWQRMVGRIGLVDLDVPVTLVSKALAGLRVYAGYAGWSAGQLEDEIAEGSWIVVPARDDDLKSAVPTRLWRRVLSRQLGDARLLANFPDDPSLN